MTEYLEITADKFTFRVATDRLYSPEGVWFQPVDPDRTDRVRVGFTDFMQQRNGDVAFLSVKPPGSRIPPGDEFADLETVKVTQGVSTPVGGTVIEVNEVLGPTPEVVNGDPYGKGWLAVIEPEDWERDRAKLLDARAYLSVMQSQVEQEIRDR